MDNKKIGGLIAAQRKEMELTQKELGQRLHVSDRAVSKWERGLNLPDAALFQPLCRELDITVTELLRGEREPPTVSQLEQMVSDTVTLAQKKERGGRKYRWIAAVLAAALALSLWPWLRRSWQQRRDQAYFDLDTTPAAVSVHYRDAALSIDISLLSGGQRMPRVSGGISETEPYEGKSREELAALHVPVIDLDGEETLFFSLQNPKTEMELGLYRWPAARLGTGQIRTAGQGVDFAPCDTPETFALPEHSYSFRAEPGYLYAVVACWGDGYYREQCFLTK